MRRSLAAVLALLAAYLIAPSSLAAQESIEEHLAVRALPGGMRLQRVATGPDSLPVWRAMDSPSVPPPIVPSPEPPKPASAVEANADPFAVTVTAGGLVTLGGDTPAEITPTAYIEAEGPLVIGDLALGRVGARVGLSTSPGEQLDLADVRTWRAADVAFSVERVVGRKRSLDSDGLLHQDITTSAVFEWGFASRQDKGAEQPATRLVRHYGAGGRFRERVSGASLTVLYGRDEEAGDRGWGQFMLFGSLPIPATKGTIVITGDATLSAGPASALHQRDILRVGVVADLGAIVGAIGGSR